MEAVESIDCLVGIVSMFMLSHVCTYVCTCLISTKGDFYSLFIGFIHAVVTGEVQ